MTLGHTRVLLWCSKGLHVELVIKKEKYWSTLFFVVVVVVFYLIPDSRWYVKLVFKKGKIWLFYKANIAFFVIIFIIMIIIRGVFFSLKHRSVWFLFAVSTEVFLARRCGLFLALTQRPVFFRELKCWERYFYVNISKFRLGWCFIACSFIQCISFCKFSTAVLVVLHNELYSASLFTMYFYA